MERRPTGPRTPWRTPRHGQEGRRPLQRRRRRQRGLARPALRNGLEAIAPWVREFYGSVRGQMTGVNVTRGNRASIKPRGGGRVVHIGFPTPLAQKMRDGLLEFVEVEGILRQNEDGRTYYVTADDVRVVEEPTLTWRELRGYMPEITEGMTVADYLEAIHGQD